MTLINTQSKIKRGIFISFEGPEGSGKSSQVRSLFQELSQRYSVVLTREPGGTCISDQIRKILLSNNNDEMLPETELLLYSAGRAQHIGELIIPALQSGKVVLCDRFSDSTIAYQGFGRQLSLDYISKLDCLVCDGLKPDLTILVDIPSKIGLKRTHEKRVQKSESFPDRIEVESPDFHNRVREGYLRLARLEPERFVIFDGTLNFETLNQRILLKLEDVIEQWYQG